MAKETAFDYKLLGHCEYGVLSDRTPSGVMDCAEAAVAKAWWGDDEDNPGSTMLLCEKHLNMVIEAEDTRKVVHG